MLTSLPGTLPIYGLTALTLACSVIADYYVDNANSTVAYAAARASWKFVSPGIGGVMLVTGTGQNIAVDSTKCYDQNYSLAVCVAEDNCQITIPFTGSGITVYVVQAGFQGVNASLKIDGGQPVTATLPPPTAPSFQTFNVSLFNIQSLSSAPHTATINLLDWENNTTSLYFDYARINESRFDHVTIPSFPSTSTSLLSLAVTTSSAINSATSQTTSSTLSTMSFSTIIPTYAPPATFAAFSVHLGPILGGACGGLAVLIAIITAIIFLRRRAVKSEKSCRPDPFIASPPLIHGHTVSSPTPALTSKRLGLNLSALRAAAPPYPTQSSSESSTLYSPLTAGGIRRNQAARLSTGTELFLVDFVIDCKREDGSLSGFRDLDQDTRPSSTHTSSAPPGYQTLEDLNASGTPVPPPSPHLCMPAEHLPPSQL